MSNINEGIKDYLPRGGFFRDEDGNKQGGYIGQGTDEQLRKAKIIAKVKAYEAEPGKRFMAGRVSSEDLKNFDDFARRYEEYFGETVDEACGKKKSKKKLSEARKKFTYTEERDSYSGTIDDLDSSYYEDCADDLINYTGISLYIFDSRYSSLMSESENNKDYEASSNGFKEFCNNHQGMKCRYLTAYEHSAVAFHIVESIKRTPYDFDTSVIGFIAMPENDNEIAIANELDYIWNGWYHEYCIFDNENNECIASEVGSSYKDLSDEFKNKARELEIEEDFLMNESVSNKAKKKLNEADKEADDAEWKTIRKNAKANPSLYGGRYADKDAKKAKKEWMNDKKSLEEDVNIDLADWGLEDLNETSEEMSVEPEEELDEMFFYDETEDEIEEERPLPKNRFKEDPEFYRHEDLEELRSKASDDDIDKVYRLSRDEVKDHNEWLKKHGKKNLMTEACKERKHKSWKKVVDSYYGKKAKSKLQESLENFNSDYPEMEEFAAIEVAPACEPCKNPEDCVCMNVPLIMRVLEFAKESNLSDEDLHKLVQKAVELCANGCCLSMDNYDELVACCQAEAPAEEEAPVEPEMEQPEEDEEIDFSELMF